MNKYKMYLLFNFSDILTKVSCQRGIYYCNDITFATHHIYWNTCFIKKRQHFVRSADKNTKTQKETMFNAVEKTKVK